MSAEMMWLLITADPEIARYAEESGVHRIFVDMETRGKQERQGHLDTHKATHTFHDIATVRGAVTKAEVLVRLNPLWQGSQGEVNEAISRGAGRLMLPMFSTAEHVEAFRKLTPTSTPITFLAETPQALVRLQEWLPHLHDGDDVHFGLNDLGIALGLDFLFEILAGGLLASAAELLNTSGIPFGIGGVARAGTGELPAEMILGEHVRLGSTRSILSRAFHGSSPSLEALTAHIDLPTEIRALNDLVTGWRHRPHDDLNENYAALANTAFALGRKRRSLG